MSNLERIEELEQKLHLATEMWAKWYSEYCEKEKQIADLSKKVERLQDDNKKLKERIKDANEIVDDIYNYQCATCARIGGCMSCGNRYAGKYMKKWGVK